MHLVPGSVFGLDRKKGPRPDMQRYQVNFDTAFAQRSLQRLRKMQSRGRRRDCTLMDREHGLVVAGIALIGRAF